MEMTLRVLVVCVVATNFATAAIAEPEAKSAPATPAATTDSATPQESEVSDDTILSRLFGSRDYCKKIDAANAAAYDKGFAALAADSVEEVKAFEARPGFAAVVAKSVAEFEAREKVSAGSGKGMCDNYIKMQ